jgi:hypothetical protein
MEPLNLELLTKFIRDAFLLILAKFTFTKPYI